MQPSTTIINGRSLNAAHRSKSEELGYIQRDFDNYRKRQNGPLMGLNGMRSVTEFNNAASAISSNTSWSGNGAVNSKENAFVRMRPKKAKQQQGFETIRPQSSGIRFRPVSTNSSASLASSGMSDIKWRNSHISSCSTIPSSWQLSRESPPSWKHEGYLEEEKEIIGRGLENAKKLIAWYHERLKSVQKRTNLLGRGLVPVDAAVHEQKLNYLRAHIAELNRRITALLESGERAFPTHSNLQGRTQMPQPSDDRSHYYRRQNVRLCQELAHKDRIIQQLVHGEMADVNHICSAFRKVDPKRITTIPVADNRNGTYPCSLSPTKAHGTLM